MPDYIFNAPEHHELLVPNEQGGEPTVYKGGQIVELSELQAAGDSRLIPADTPGFAGVPAPVEQGAPDEALVRARAIDNQPLGTAEEQDA